MELMFSGPTSAPCLAAIVSLAKAAAVQYGQIRAIEHVHPLVRTQRQLSRVLQEIESAPGIVLQIQCRSVGTSKLNRTAVSRAARGRR